VWGAAMAKDLIGEELFDELYKLAHTNKPFDRVVFEVKKVELERISQ
jgi:hypothetical protein